MVSQRTYSKTAESCHGHLPECSCYICGVDMCSGVQVGDKHLLGCGYPHFKAMDQMLVPFLCAICIVFVTGPLADLEHTSLGGHLVLPPKQQQ